MPIAEVSSVVLTSQGVKDAWDQLKAHVAAVGPWDLATVHLYVNNIAPTMLTTEVDLGEVDVATWAEYVAIASTGWGVDEVRPDGSVLAVASPLFQWTGPALGGGPTVYGAYIKSPLAGTHLLAIMPFVTAIGMPNNTKVLSLDLPQLLSGGPWAV